MNPVPLSWMLIAFIAATLTAGGTGWHYGQKVCRADYAAAEMKRVKADEEARAVIAAKDREKAKLAAARAAKRQARQAMVEQETLKHVQTIPDPPECALDPERVRNINRAFGVDEPDTGGKAAAVSVTATAREWWAQRRGNLGNGNGEAVSGVRGSSQ